MRTGKRWWPHARSVVLGAMGTARPRPPTHGHLSWLQVFSYVATLLYVVHAVFSLIRWKSS